MLIECEVVSPNAVGLLGDCRMTSTSLQLYTLHLNEDANPVGAGEEEQRNKKKLGETDGRPIIILVVSK